MTPSDSAFVSDLIFFAGLPTVFWFSSRLPFGNYGEPRRLKILIIEMSTPHPYSNFIHYKSILHRLATIDNAADWAITLYYRLSKKVK